MGSFTLIPAWIVQDLIVYLATLVTVIFIIRKEQHPEIILLEMVCFTFLYAAVYENFATLMGWYGYGRSLVMVGNVPLSVPMVEYIVVYSTLRMLDHMVIPTWSKPLVVGMSGMLFDFALDPLAIKLVYAAKEGTIGRWTWFMNPTDVGIYGEPVYNFSGWVLICGYAAAFLLIGRWWQRKSRHGRAVGYIYPILAMLASLGVLVSPVSRFLLWAEPFFQKGSVGEWIMLPIYFIVPAALLGVLWRGRMKRGFRLKENFPVPLVLVGLPLVTVVSTLIYGVFEILWLEALSAGLLALLVAGVVLSGRRLKGSEPAGSALR
jgi:hypothetical protein